MALCKECKSLSVRIIGVSPRANLAANDTIERAEKTDWSSRQYANRSRYHDILLLTFNEITDIDHKGYGVADSGGLK